MQVGVRTGRTQHAKLHQLLVSAGRVEGLAHVRPGVRRLRPGQLQRVGTCHGAGRGWGDGSQPLASKRAAPRSTPPVLEPPRPPAQSRVQGGSSGSPAELGPSLGLPTRQEEDLFPRGEGLAVLVPRDLRARVSVDSAGEGDAVVDDGRDLLHVRARDSRWDCPRGHRDKDRHVRPHLGRGTESYSVTHRALRAPGAPSDDTARQPLFVRVTSQRRAQGLGDRREPLCQGPPAGEGQNQNTHLCESWTFAP